MDARARTVPEILPGGPPPRDPAVHPGAVAGIETGAGPAIAIPADIAFLRRHGVDEDRLERAAAAAQDAGVPAATALLRLGLVEEGVFYRALAHELGLPFADEPVLGRAVMPDRAGGVIEATIGAGVAARPPRHGGGHLFAPAPDAVGAALRGLGVRGPCAVTSPSRLRDAVLRARGGEVAHAAAEALRQRAPHWAYGPGLAGRQAARIAVGLAGFAIVLVAVPAARAVLALPPAMFFLWMAGLRLAAALRPAPIAPGPSEPWPLEDRDLPVYTVVVALYREAAVVPRIVRALAALDYPAAKLEVIFVLEADDPGTRAALAAVPLPGRFQVVVAPPGRPRTKPRALNVVLPLARGELLVVYDAEDVPDPGQLRQAAARFARAEPELACLQGRLVVDNDGDGLLTRLFALEYTALFDVLVPALARDGLPIPLGGTSTHFRAGVLRRLAGWDAWNVTEDADLGVRLALAGYRVGDLPSATLEEAPADLGRWMRQRTRWMKGFAQVALTHSRRPLANLRALGPGGFLTVLALVPGTLVAALLYPALTGAALLALVLPGEAPLGLLGGAVLTTGLAAMIVPAGIGAARRGWWGLVPLAALMPLYFVLLSAAAWLALLELVRHPARWNKTEHGLARTSRSGALLPRGARRAGGNGAGGVRAIGRGRRPPRPAGAPG